MLEREGLVDGEARLATGVVNLGRWNLLWSAFRASLQVLQYTHDYSVRFQLLLVTVW